MMEQFYIRWNRATTAILFNTDDTPGTLSCNVSTGPEQSDRASVQNNTEDKDLDWVDGDLINEAIFIAKREFHLNISTTTSICRCYCCWLLMMLLMMLMLMLILMLLLMLMQMLFVANHNNDDAADDGRCFIGDYFGNRAICIN